MWLNIALLCGTLCWGLVGALGISQQAIAADRSDNVIAQTPPSSNPKSATAQEIAALIERLKNPADYLRQQKPLSLKQAKQKLEEANANVQLAQTKETRMAMLAKEGAVHPGLFHSGQ